jgi:hypothetical protein
MIRVDVQNDASEEDLWPFSGIGVWQCEFMPSGHAIWRFVRTAPTPEISFRFTLFSAFKDALSNYQNCIGAINSIPTEDLFHHRDCVLPHVIVGF